jgi:hypothetical protein
MSCDELKSYAFRVTSMPVFKNGDWSYGPNNSMFMKF